MARSVGIDVGTANWAIAVMDGARPTVVPNADGATTTPSAVAFPVGGGRLIGAAARRQRLANPDRTIVGAERFIGRQYDEVEREHPGTAVGLEAGPNGSIRFRIGDRTVTAEAIAAQILRQLVDDAARFVGTPVNETVIAVPVAFDDGQRRAIRDAGRMAGLEVLRIIDEPTAMMLARPTADQASLVGDGMASQSGGELVASGAALQAALITGELSGGRRAPV